MLNIISKFLRWLKGYQPTTTRPQVGPGPQAPRVDDPPTNHPGLNDSPRLVLGVIVGHEKKSPGASLHGGGNEYMYNKEIAEIVRSMCAGTAIDCKIIYRDGIGISGACNRAAELNCDCVIELHFNGFNGTANGTHTLTSSSSEDLEFAHVVHKAMLGVFGTDGRKDRGVKALSRSDRGGRNVTSLQGIPNCLVEPAFGDNPREADLLRTKKREYANCLVQAVVTWARKKDLL